jgi:hypothetical protein
VSLVKFSTAGGECAIAGRAGDYMRDAALLIGELETSVHRATEHVKQKTKSTRQVPPQTSDDVLPGDRGTPAEFFQTIEDLLRLDAVGAACVVFYDIEDQVYIVRYVST